MGDQYQVEANTNSNNNTYPWVVVDLHDDAKIIAFAVTQHTANSYAKQLNEDGYIYAV